MSRISLYLILFTLIFNTDLLVAQSIVINEVNQAGQWVELYNASTTETTDVSGWWLCNYPDYNRITATSGITTNVTIISGNTMMAPNSYLVLGWASIRTPDGDVTDGELGLYSAQGFGVQANIRDYMQYGTGNHRRAQLATDAGYWNGAAAFVPYTSVSGNSMIVTDMTATGPSDTDSNDWADGMPSQGMANGTAGNPCDPLLAINDNPIAPGTYRAVRITSAGRIADNGSEQSSFVIFLAEEDVRLNQNFQIDQGGILEANIEDCP